MDPQTLPSYEFGPFRLQPAERVLLRGTDVVPLAVKAFEVLSYLIQNRGRVVAKDALIRHVWPDCFVEENNLTQNISALRRVFADDPEQPKYIETIPRRGYRFVANVREAGESTGSLAKSEAPATRRAQVKSLAVLPFQSIGSDAGPDFLALGMADALITRLGNIEQIEVRPTASVLRYDGHAPDWASAGRDLRVDALLSGCIQRAGDRVRVTVQLIAVEDGTTLWAGQFDDPFTDIFSVEDSISQQVTRTLMLKLSGDESRRLSKRHTVNAEAHQSYLRGRYYWNRRTEQDLRKSVRCFQEAVNLDPSYALAYVGLADSYSVLGGYSDLPPKEAYSLTRAAAMQALEIDETLAEAHTSLGDVFMYLSWDAARAEKEYCRAVELRPDYATGHHFYAWFLMSQGKFAQASAEMKRAQELDPLSPMINTTVGLPLYFARQYPQAISHFEKSVESDPAFDLGFVYLARAYTQCGRHKEAIAALRNAVTISGGRPVTIAGLSNALARAGERKEAIQLRDDLMARAATRYVSPYYIATIFSGLNDRVNAFKWLENAFEDRSNQLVVLGLDPAWDAFREDAKFTALFDRVGFSPAR